MPQNPSQTHLKTNCLGKAKTVGSRNKQKVHLRGLFAWSGRQDLNLRPRGPKPRALPDCATPRSFVLNEADYIEKQSVLLVVGVAIGVTGLSRVFSDALFPAVLGRNEQALFCLRSSFTTRRTPFLHTAHTNQDKTANFRWWRCLGRGDWI